MLIEHDCNIEASAFEPPKGCLQWKIRERRECFPVAYLRFKDRTESRMLSFNGGGVLVARDDDILGINHNQKKPQKTPPTFTEEQKQAIKRIALDAIRESRQRGVRL